MSRTASIGLVMLLAAHAFSLRAQEERMSTQQPLQTDLLNVLDASHLKPGAPVLAKVRYKWDGPDCALSAGSTVGGTVVEVHIDKVTRQAAIAIHMDTADCNGRLSSHLPCMSSRSS